MLNLRITLPARRAGEVLTCLRASPACINLVHLPGASLEPSGDVVLVDVAREGADTVLEQLRALQVPRFGSIAVHDVDLSLSARADRAERAAPGRGSDALVWEDLVARTREESTVSATYLTLFAVATTLAGLAVLTDSAVLVIGAMIVGPEYGALAGISAAVVLRRRQALLRSVVALVVGFATGTAVAVVATLALAPLGLVDAAMLTQPRPQTEFIYNPDPLSFVVAFLAGVAGMVALTSAKSGAVVGVLVSVTTVPAAGNTAVALAFALTSGTEDSTGGGAARTVLLDQAWTSLEQLVLNVLGILIAGTLTLYVQRHLLRRRTRRQGPTGARTL